MEFKTSTIEEMDERFKETLAKEFKKHSVKKISDIPDVERRNQLQSIQDTIHRFKKYPSSLPVLERQVLLTAALAEVKAQIFERYNSRIKKGLSVIGLGRFISEKNSVVYSDIDWIIGNTENNNLDAETSKKYEKKYHRYLYLENCGKTEAYYHFEKHIIPNQTLVEKQNSNESNFALKTRLKSLKNNPKLDSPETTQSQKTFGPINVPWKDNYVFTKPNEIEITDGKNKTFETAKNKRIDDNTDPYKYLSTRQGMIRVNGRPKTIPSERDTFNLHEKVTKALILGIHNFDKNKLKKMDPKQVREANPFINKGHIRKVTAWEEVPLKKEGKKVMEWMKKPKRTKAEKAMLTEKPDSNQKQHVVHHESLRTLNQTYKPLKITPRLWLPDGRKAKNHRYEIDEQGTAKAYYFRHIHADIKQYNKDAPSSIGSGELEKEGKTPIEKSFVCDFTLLKPILKSTKEEQALKERRRLGVEFTGVRPSFKR